MAPLSGALDVSEAAGIDRIHENYSPSLTTSSGSSTNVSPEYSVNHVQGPARRCGPVALEHSEAESIVTAQKRRGVVVVVVVDYRQPHVGRV